MATEPAARAGTGDLAPGCALIEVHVGELKHLFNSLDPTPFRERDLDPKAEEFIAGWASELHGDAPLCLVVHVDRGDVAAAEVTMLREAVGGRSRCSCTTGGPSAPRRGVTIASA